MKTHSFTNTNYFWAVDCRRPVVVSSFVNIIPRKDAMDPFSYGIHLPKDMPCAVTTDTYRMNILPLDKSYGKKYPNIVYAPRKVGYYGEGVRKELSKTASMDSDLILSLLPSKKRWICELKHTELGEIRHEAGRYCRQAMKIKNIGMDGDIVVKFDGFEVRFDPIYFYDALNFIYPSITTQVICNPIKRKGMKHSGEINFVGQDSRISILRPRSIVRRDIIESRLFSEYDASGYDQGWAKPHYGIFHEMVKGHSSK